MAEVATVDAFSIYSHYLQGIYKVVYYYKAQNGSTMGGVGGGSHEDCRPIVRIANSRAC